MDATSSAPVATNTPIVNITDTATPRIALQNTRVRKVMCRGLTPKHKNIEANTLTVLQAMQTNPPFFPYGQKRAAWEAVASLARSNPDLLHVNGTLCEGRYKQVRDEYKAAQAAARRATGTAEPAPSEQDMILENLIRLEEDVEKREEEEKQRQAAQTADENQLQATALDIRDAAVRFVAQDTDPATESVHTKNVIDELPTPKRRKRRFDGDKAEFDKTNQLLQQALLKYLNK